MGNDILISTDKSKLDIEMIHNYLSNESYWANGRTINEVLTSIENSVCFGVYLEGKQVAFARVLTDYVVFAWVMDVFVLPEYQGKSIGKELIKFINEYPDFQSIKTWGLKTFDAHSLYEQIGFKEIESPEIFMEKK